MLSVRGLSKRFGGTAALCDVDFTVQPAQIHALLGANGAGKSTLIKILAGVYRPDAGDILLQGRSLAGMSKQRISFVHQDLALIESMTVGENMALSYGYPTRWRFIDWDGVNVAAAQALKLLDSPLPMDKPVSALSRAEKSIVAIARALTKDVDLLVLDEPTASLPEADVGRLLGFLNRLRERHISIVYVSHRLDEVFRVPDAVTVLRDGRVIATYATSAVSPDQLIADIVGKSLTTRSFIAHASSGVPVLEVQDLRIGHVGPVSFRIARGEIVGFAGLRGQGQEAVGRVLAGIEPRDSGTVRLSGKDVRSDSISAMIAAGVAFVTSKRTEEALAPIFTVKENLFLNPENFGRRFWQARRPATERRDAAGILKKFNVRPSDPDREIMTLSGGNQQKVVLARWADRHYKLLILEEPTMGVDVGAKEQIYRMLTRDAVGGTAYVVISSDQDELVQICDRDFAFGRGRIVAELDRDMLSVEALTRQISGAAESVAQAENVSLH